MAVDSTSAATCTSTPRSSASVCIRKRLRAGPPSTRRLGSASPASACIASSTSATRWASPSSVARASSAGPLPAAQPEDRAARLRLPVRRGQAGQRRYEQWRRRRVGRLGQGATLGRIGDQLQLIAQPLDRRAGHEHAAIERVMGQLRRLPGHRAKQPVVAQRRPLASVEQQKGTRAKGTLSHPWRKATLPEQRRLLIAQQPVQRQRCARPARSHRPARRKAPPAAGWRAARRTASAVRRPRPAYGCCTAACARPCWGRSGAAARR